MKKTKIVWSDKNKKRDGDEDHIRIKRECRYKAVVYFDVDDEAQAFDLLDEAMSEGTCLGIDAYAIESVKVNQ